MRKLLMLLTISLNIWQTGISQDIDLRVQHKVDSLKMILPRTSGTARVDVLNSMAQGLLWIYESDKNYLYEALKYAEEANKAARKLNYKRGEGYSLLTLFFKEADNIDTNRANNKNPGSHFNKAIAIANQAYHIGETLKDDILMGAVMGTLVWLHRWHGEKEDYIAALQKSIAHYEKALTKDWKGIYVPLKITDCDNCLGVEFNLGDLYRQQAEIKILFKDETVQKILKSIYYYEKANALSAVGDQYLRAANVLAQFNDLRTAVAEAKKSFPYYSKQQDGNGEFDACQTLCGLYYELGDLENGLLYSKKAVRLAETLAMSKGKYNELNYPDENRFFNEKRLFHAYFWIGRFYTLAGDHENALAYFRKAAGHNFDNRWSNAWSSAMGNLYRSSGNYDSALVYFNPNTAKVSLVRLYSEMGRYDNALKLFNETIPIVTERNNIANIGRLHAYAAKAYYGKKNYSRALSDAKYADEIFKKTNNNLERIDNYQVLSEIYERVQKYDSAYLYLKQYNMLRDSVLNKTFYIRLNEFRKEAEEEKRMGQLKLLEKDNVIKGQQLAQQILLKAQDEAQLILLNKDNEIKEQNLKLKDQELNRQLLLKDKARSQLTLLDRENRLKDERLKQHANTRNTLLAGFLLFIVLTLVVLRNLALKRKNEALAIKQQQSDIQQRIAELEMQALRAQMNPHFIFNSLSSINKFILHNDTDAASTYLTRFSRLIRQVLINSQLTSIPLSDEIEMLRLYLEMERLRFNESFIYNISVENMPEPEMIYIPPMLLQPFCENAVWHGLMHKDGERRLDIVLSLQDDYLYCTIADNGIGRSRSEEIKKKMNRDQKSFGLKITAERLALFNGQKGNENFFFMEDITDKNGNIAGTRVNLNIRIRNSASSKTKHDTFHNH